MLAKLTVPELQFLSRLGRSPDYALLQTILSKELSSHDEQCRKADGPALYRAQGVSVWLVSLAEKIRNADEELERTAQNRSHQPLRTVNGLPYK